MILGTVSLPDELLIALEENRLVIFAGAGVSMPPPSNLPTFNCLASKIAGGETVENGTEDRFLGQLKQNRGTEVHLAAAEILCGDHTRPTLLHRELLRLFDEPNKVRIVTTNFDDHFSAAAQEIFGEDLPREYCAPALPLGDDFSGLVYLHGSARVDPRKLVLTDRDFGAAYLTRSWARDFLVSLFSSYTVLFVGYSHSDVTMTYLARGLNPSTVGKRWALVSSDDMNALENWKHLDIPVVSYTIAPGHPENKHVAVTELFKQWADHNTGDIFSRLERVKTIASGLPPEGEADAAYLHYCLSQPRLAEDFCNAIRHPDWIEWMSDRGYLNGLFSDSAADSVVPPSEHIITQWLCSYVRTRFPETLLDLIIRHKQCLSSRFSRRLAQSLCYERSNTSDPLFATWMSILLSQRSNPVDRNTWGYLLTKCRVPDHLGVALCIFELLTAPCVQLEKNLRGYLPDSEDDEHTNCGFKVDYHIEWPKESGYCLNEVWNNVFQPHLSVVAEPLGQIVTKQLKHAYLLLAGVGKDHKQYDRISRSRSSITPHEQDDISLDRCQDCLIDIFRSIIDYWIQTDSARARVQTEDLWSSNLPLLQRFAAYVYCQDPQYGADDRIEWVLANDLVFLSGMKKEVFDILASAYGEASFGVRQRLLRRIDCGVRGLEVEWLDEKTLAYEKFNVLIWLRRSDPGCLLVQSAISAIHEKFPKFEECQHPEFDSWHGPDDSVDPEQGFDLELIFSKPPIEFVSKLIQARHHPHFWAQQDYIGFLPRLFQKDRIWTEGFIHALSKCSDVDGEIWNGVVRGLRGNVGGEEEWYWIISLIEMLPRDIVVYEAAANLLSWGLRECHMVMGDELIERAAVLMSAVWDLCKDKEEPADADDGDWYTTAINHIGGEIGEFWVRYCIHLRRQASEHWQGIPDQLKSKIIEAINGTSRIKAHARIALTPWGGAFYLWDPDFAIEHLLPLFDWKRDPVVAQQSWTVLLNYKRRITKDFEAQLLPFYRQCAEQVTGMMKEATEQSGQFNEHSIWQLGSQLAMLAIHVISDPVESGFFRDFLPLLPDQARESFAIGIGAQLRSMNEAERQRVWDAWLRRYLDLRLVGIPIALATSETEHMLGWSLHLGSAFPEAIARLGRMPQGAFFTYGILKDLAESPVVDKFPLDACRLAVEAMRAEDYPVLHDFLIDLHQRFKSKIHEEQIFLDFERLLCHRGWTRP